MRALVEVKICIEEAHHVLGVDEMVHIRVQVLISFFFRVTHILSRQEDLDARRIAQLEHMIQSGNSGDLRDNVRVQSLVLGFVAPLPISTNRR